MSLELTQRLEDSARNLGADLFGVAPMERFSSVVTDAPLTPGSTADVQNPCEGCPRPCVTACPVGAIAASETFTVHVGATQHQLGGFDCLRCDWAKKYGFVAAEGPGLMGQTTDIAPPAGPISAEQIAEAMSLKDPVQRHWSCVVERCLQVCQRRLQKEES